jgi:hypothetical protein
VEIYGVGLARRRVQERKTQVDLSKRIEERVREAIEGSGLESVFEFDEMYETDRTAGAALKSILAEKAAEYTMRAMEEAKKRRIRLGAAAVILAVKKR